MSSYPKTPKLSRRFLTVELDDVSTAGQVYVVPGFRGKIKKIWTALNGAIATADAVLTAKINGTAVSGGAVTIAYSGSAAGDVDSATPTGASYNNAFGEGDAIEIETNGASTNTIKVVITLELEAT